MISIMLKSPLVMCPHLTFYKHVEEVIAGLLMVSLANKMPQVVMCNPKAWKVSNTYTLIVKTATLRASNQIKELFSLRGSSNCRI